MTPGSDTEEPVVVRRERLEHWVEELLDSCGVSPAQSASVAGALAQADARGLHTHGCEMLPRYVRGFTEGLLNRTPEVRRTGGRGAISVWDADGGLGHYACDVVAAALAGPAREHGIAAASIGNSNHFGAASRYGLHLAEQGLIAFITTNTPAVMPPWGGHGAVIGNNPLAWVLPRAAKEPIVLDMAVSAVARGKIRLAAAAGEPIPVGWATDASGADTTDASAALEGHLLPVGGPKGYGLAVVNEILAAALPAARVLTEVSTRTITVGDVHDDWHIGHLLIAIDPSATGPYERYLERVETVASVLTSQSGGPGGPVLLPGDPEAAAEARSADRGVRLPHATAAAVTRLSEQHELPVPWTNDRKD